MQDILKIFAYPALMERLHARAYCIGSAGPRREVNDAEAVGAGLHFGEGVSLMYDCFRLRSTSSMVSSFLPSPPKEETKQRRKGAARSLRPGSLAGRYLRLTRSLRSLRQADRLTPPTRLPPFGHRAPFKRAGCCTSAGLVSRIFNAPPLCSRLSSWREQAYIMARMMSKLSVQISS